MSGARTDLGEFEAALAVLDQIPAADAQGDLALRVLQAKASVLEAAGRDEEAAEILAGVDPVRWPLRSVPRSTRRSSSTT
ncbi:hypothetical protein NKG05_30270 [Oerskovia sp. M15]